LATVVGDVDGAVAGAGLEDWVLLLGGAGFVDGDLACFLGGVDACGGVGVFEEAGVFLLSEGVGEGFFFSEIER
jgi:hypothetical protein